MNAIVASTIVHDLAKTLDYLKRQKNKYAERQRVVIPTVIVNEMLDLLRY